MSDNWVVQNLENALNTWNEKLAEIWQLITQSPENFKGGAIWNVIVDIHGAVQAIGLALLVLFFVVGVMRTCGNFAEVKRPEQALKLFIRFALAKGAVTYGLELMMALFKIVQGIISTIMNAAGFGAAQQTVLPQEIVTAVEDCGFFESTQNVDDLLQSHTARTMLANSEFIIMLNQASTDRIELAKLLNISDLQMSYITNVGAGQGLLKVGSSLVPFVNKFPRNTELYKLMTTKFGEC